MTDLFRSADLLVRRVPGIGAGNRACCAVTFDSWTDRRSLDRTGFGQNVLHDAGIDAVHVLSRDNDWYQYPELLAALEPVHAATRGYGRVTAYGSSMGAYAALRLAGVVGADTVLALSPQFSIARRVAPWEGRWPYNTAQFRDVWESTLPFPAPQPAYVVFDPTDLDRRHVARFAAAMPVVPVPVPGAGHPVTGVLAEMGLLKDTLLAVCRGTFDPAAFIAAAEARRPHSAQMMVFAADRTAAWRPGRRRALLQQALALAPDDPVVQSRLAAELRRAGRHAEALALHGRALHAAPDNPALLLSHALTLAASGDAAAAAAAADAVVAHAGGNGLYEARLRSLRARLRFPGWGALAPMRAWLADAGRR